MKSSKLKNGAVVSKRGLVGPRQEYNGNSESSSESMKSPGKRKKLILLAVILVFFLVSIAITFVLTEPFSDESIVFTSFPTTDTPTGTLTRSPTVNPTGLPTKNPTESPSKSPTESPTYSPTESPTKSPTELNFCSDLGSNDEVVKGLLAFFFINRLNSDKTKVQFSDVNIKCLPRNAFELLNEEDVTTLLQLTELGFESGLERVHPKAFNEFLVKNILVLNLSGNNLDTLPDDVFSPFKSMHSLILDGNNFVTLNNNILGNLPNLLSVSMGDCNQLLEFPEFLPNAPNLEEALFGPCSGLSIANSEAFFGLTNLQKIQFHSGISPILNQLGKEDLAIILGVNVAVIEELFDFCHSFPIEGEVDVTRNEDQLVRELIVSFGLGSSTLILPQVRCLPENAFSLFSDDDKDFIRTFVNGIAVLFDGLEIIHTNAFDLDLFPRVTGLDIGNKLTALPNNVLEPFPNLEFLFLRENFFVTLSNDIFGDTGAKESLELLRITDPVNLREFPEIMKFTPNLKILDIFRATQLSELNAEAFVNVDLDILFISSDTPVVASFTKEEIAEILGIPVETISIIDL